MVTSPTTPKGLTNGTSVESRTTAASTPHQNSTGSANTGSATGSNRLTPNISVNLVHHLHPNVSQYYIFEFANFTEILLIETCEVPSDTNVSKIEKLVPYFQIEFLWN